MWRGGMTILEYIEEYYPIQERVDRLMRDPFTLVKESDDLPYDEIMFYDGKVQKVVLYDDEIIPVYDLLLYDPSDVDAMPDGAFKEMYKIYMEQVDIKTLSIQEIMSAVRDYEQHKAELKEKVSGCSN